MARLQCAPPARPSGDLRRASGENYARGLPPLRQDFRRDKAGGDAAERDFQQPRRHRDKSISVTSPASDRAPPPSIEKPNFGGRSCSAVSRASRAPALRQAVARPAARRRRNRRAGSARCCAPLPCGRRRQAGRASLIPVAAARCPHCARPASGDWRGRKDRRRHSKAAREFSKNLCAIKGENAVCQAQAENITVAAEHGRERSWAPTRRLEFISGGRQPLPSVPLMPARISARIAAVEFLRDAQKPRLSASTNFSAIDRAARGFSFR